MFFWQIQKGQTNLPPLGTTWCQKMAIMSFEAALKEMTAWDARRRSANRITTLKSLKRGNIDNGRLLLPSNFSI